MSECPECHQVLESKKLVYESGSMEVLPWHQISAGRSCPRSMMPIPETIKHKIGEAGSA